jgi:hypothetical protein
MAPTIAGHPQRRSVARRRRAPYSSFAVGCRRSPIDSIGTGRRALLSNWFGGRYRARTWVHGFTLRARRLLDHDTAAGSDSDRASQSRLRNGRWHGRSPPHRYCAHRAGATKCPRRTTRVWTAAAANSSGGLYRVAYRVTVPSAPFACAVIAAFEDEPTTATSLAHGVVPRRNISSP